MTEALFDAQDSLGSKTWTSIARNAGIRDTLTFLSCMSADSTRYRIEADQELASTYAISGTPTVVINGWRYSRPPTWASLIEIVDGVQNGESPFPRRNLARIVDWLQQ